MNLSQRKRAFIRLGEFLGSFLNEEQDALQSSHGKKLSNAIVNAGHVNGWFTSDNVETAIASIADMLREKQIDKWLDSYLPDLENISEQNIGTIMAGNIPLVGFHDFLCILISGHRFYGKLSSSDSILLPVLADLLIETEPGFAERIFFQEQLKDIDAVIATGSNNTSRYFDYYFGKYPHIIRKNRNSVAVLDGNENQEELSALGKDIFCYFGLGCRNVSKLFVPENYDFDILFKALFSYKTVLDHNKYANNYYYYRTIYLMNKEQLLDNGFLLLKEDKSMVSPPGALFYEYYSGKSSLEKRLENEAAQIQCLVGKQGTAFGQAQHPGLSDYADQKDTIRFLNALN